MKDAIKKFLKTIPLKGKVTMKGVWTITIRDAVTGQIKRQHVFENLIPTTGRNNVAKALAGDLSAIAEAEINFTSLGTDATAPTNGDTKLGTETFRKSVASSTSSGNQLFVTAFYTAPEVSGTFDEAGLHINGTGAADSGILFSRVTFSPAVVKSASETLTVDYTVTIT